VLLLYICLEMESLSFTRINVVFYCTQVLLNVYILADVTARTKQIILLYTFCDLLNLASSEACKTQVCCLF